MSEAESFVKYFNKTYTRVLTPQKQPQTKKSNDFLNEFVIYIPEILEELQQHINNKQFNEFYVKLSNLKFLIEYSDELNRYWFVLRAYSGGLKRLMESLTVQDAMEVYLYYYHKYGERRSLKDENWFEKRRWLFLDELMDVEDDKNLLLFMDTTTERFNDYFQIYKAELNKFRNEVINLL